MLALQLRRATPADAAALFALMAAAADRLAARGYGNWLPHYPADRIAADTVERDVWAVHAARAPGAPLVAVFMLGAAPKTPYAPGAWPDRDAPAIYLNRIAVHPAWQGRGVASWCLARADALARAAGASVIRCDVLAANTGLRGFYERHGYVKRGARTHSGWEFACYEKGVEG